MNFDMNIVDVVIILLILMFGASGAKKGFFKQTVSTVGFILVVIMAFYLKNPVAEYISLTFPFFDFGGHLANSASANIIFYQLLSFAIVIVVLQVILKVLIKITGLIEKILKFTIILGIPSKILGGLVGLIEGFIIVFLVLFFIKQPGFDLDIVNESKLTDPILKSTPVLSQIAGDFVDVFNDLYDLGNDYYEQKLDENTLNLKSIDTMLEHGIVTPDYIRKLVDNDKIDIIGIDSIINKYK